MISLDIQREDQQDQGVLLHCSGRLDATSTDHLTDYVERLVRGRKIPGSTLDLSRIEYMSSAGIRALVVQHKNLQSLNGHFYIIRSSDNVAQVLAMVGMSDMFSPPDPEGRPGKGRNTGLHNRRRRIRFPDAGA